MTDVWADDHVTMLHDCRAKGLSCSQTAAAINARFGTRYSRNAVIGKALRSGAARAQGQMPAGLRQEVRGPRDTATRAAKPRPVPPRPRGAARSTLTHISFGAVARALPRVAAPPLACVPVDPRHLALTDLGATDCRYPYGGDAIDEPITFCGHPRLFPAPYCAGHCALTMRPASSGTAEVRSWR